MIKFMKTGLMVFPWIGMVILGFLYFASNIDLAISEHYMSQSFKAMEGHQEELTNFIKSRRDYENDKLAFHDLDLILPDQYNGKYEPWLSTKMGFIKFDSEGFIVAICSPETGLNNPECPPEM